MSEAKLNVSKFSEDMWIFTEVGGGNVDAYLLVGKEKAVLIDSLTVIPALWDDVRKITDLPLELLVTHGHLDHIGIATLELMEKGVPVHMDRKDIDMAESRLNTKLDNIIDIPDGKIFDLGGIKLEAISLPGHTKGSMVFLDREKRRIFTGDAIGSGGFWMQLDCCTNLEELLENIDSLKNKLDGLENIVVHPGHRYQSPVPLGMNYIDDVRYVTAGIVDGSIVGEAKTMDFHGGIMHYNQVVHGLINDYCYNPKNIKK